jgi:hypothetical protein
MQPVERRQQSPLHGLSTEKFGQLAQLLALLFYMMSRGVGENGWRSVPDHIKSIGLWTEKPGQALHPDYLQGLRFPWPGTAPHGWWVEMH